ncbi:MFS transporter [Corynebacterium sp. sy017]|uniref:MFS transporter n=1 Tax=unclassified Corynebacterium TaxID=2624378 RepID=UPI001186336E|nr:MULTISPECIES: MFS transporter [unclassified Corynebacterium]MBP3089092.1 MFS transporter [Corynebacterium sp. sy017]TSD91406.1 MFS transporter [Corynebacterium sp. SY003]
MNHTMKMTLGLIVLSYFLILLDNSVIFTALPPLRESMNLSSSQLAWVQDAYTLTFGGFLLLGARLGDLLGYRKVFLSGLALFVASSFLVGISPFPEWLITARAIQGLGAAIVAPCSLSLLTISFPQEQARARAVAIYAATAGIGASAGLIIGGAAAQWFSWRMGFFINVPVGIVIAMLAPRYLPASHAKPGKFDIPGALGATVGSALLVFGIIEFSSANSHGVIPVACVVAALVILGVTLWHERRTTHAIIDLSLFADRRRCGAYAARFLYLGAMIGFFFFSTQLMQDCLGFSPLEAGCGFLPMTVVNFIVAMLVPRLSQKYGDLWLLIVGVSLTLCGMFVLSQVDSTSQYVYHIAPAMVVIGAGQGAAFAPLTSFGIIGATSENSGAASGMVNTVHQIGMATGLAILVAVSSHAGSTLEQVATALHWGCVILALCLIVCVGVIAPGVKRSKA